MVEDNKYKRGKIYRIYCEDECYIGSTIEPYISNRLSGHKKAYKYFLNGKPVIGTYDNIESTSKPQPINRETVPIKKPNNDKNFKQP